MTKTKIFAVETTWLPGCGWGNGYVAIPRDHPFWKRIVEIDDLEVHGGITFKDDGYIFNRYFGADVPEDCLVIGFDTGHTGDNLSTWPDEESVLKECRNIQAQIDCFLCQRWV